jgi:hypothetical protein
MNEPGLHQLLDVLLRLRRTYDREGASGDSIQRLLKDCLIFARDIMGEDLFRSAMLQGDDGEGLLLLANRFVILKPLLEDNWPCDFTFSEVVNELFAVANGDEPRILKGKGKQGKFGSAHALLERKLEAHLWYKVMGRLGLKAADRQKIIEDSFAITFLTFNKWRQEAVRKLGSDYVERFFHTGIEAKLFSATMETSPALWAKDQTRIAGENYKRTLRACA